MKVALTALSALWLAIGCASDPKQRAALHNPTDAGEAPAALQGQLQPVVEEVASLAVVVQLFKQSHGEWPKSIDELRQFEAEIHLPTILDQFEAMTFEEQAASSSLIIHFESRPRPDRGPTSGTIRVNPSG